MGQINYIIKKSRKYSFQEIELSQEAYQNAYSRNGSFTKRRVTRDALMIRRTRRRCVHRAQPGHGIKNVLRAGFKLAKKLATSNIGRQLGKAAIENAP